MARPKKIEKIEIEEAIEEAGALQSGPSERERLEYEREDLVELLARLTALGANSKGDIENKIAKLNQALS